MGVAKARLAGSELVCDSPLVMGTCVSEVGAVGCGVSIFLPVLGTPYTS